MSGEVEFKGIDSKDDVKINFEQSNGPKKPSDKEVAQYSKLRLALVIFFGVVIIAMVAAAVIIIIVSPRCAKAKGKLDKSWVREGVVYQIYPRSFKDSSGNGIGDLRGIIEKIGYLKDLQVNVIRLYSIYDLNNQTQINPDYGTMEDFDEFLNKAHEQKMKVLFDFIPNHTPDNHPWFLESKKSKDNGKRSWYVWKDGKIGSNNTREPPNNWLSVPNGDQAWTYDSATGQYFLHQFKKDQPDLNLTNSKVKEALKNVMKFWLDKGVDGFVARHVQYMVEDSSFLDEQKSGLNSSNKYDTLQHSRTYGKTAQPCASCFNSNLFIIDFFCLEVPRFCLDSNRITSFTGLTI